MISETGHKHTKNLHYQKISFYYLKLATLKNIQPKSEMLSEAVSGISPLQQSCSGHNTKHFSYNYKY